MLAFVFVAEGLSPRIGIVTPALSCGLSGLVVDDEMNVPVLRLKEDGDPVGVLLRCTGFFPTGGAGFLFVEVEDAVDTMLLGLGTVEESGGGRTVRA
jgi:hypothetical protein